MIPRNKMNRDSLGHSNSIEAKHFAHNTEPQLLTRYRISHTLGLTSVKTAFCKRSVRGSPRDALMLQPAAVAHLESQSYFGRQIAFEKI